MNNSILVSESTLTDRYQTTVPDSVRKALHLHKREKIRYTIQSDGNVLMSRADKNEADPALAHFLSFLADDLTKNPDHLKAVSGELVERVKALVSNVEIDLDSPLSEKDN